MQIELRNDPSFRPLDILSIGNDIAVDQILETIVTDVKVVSFVSRHAGSLNEGFEYLAENDIDLILLALDLPDSKGLGTFMRIRGLAPEIPIVVITTREDEAVSRRLIMEGAYDCIFASQLRPSVIMRTLMYALERKGWKDYVSECHGARERNGNGARPRPW